VLVKILQYVKIEIGVVKMDLLVVDLDKCIKCGRCADVCPTRVIGMGAKGPVEGERRSCIACGQCVAVCPTVALDNRKAPLVQQTQVDEKLQIGVEEATQFLRSRRSVRCYEIQVVEQHKLEQLLDMARLAPTGGNTQGLSYLVISDQDKLKEITAATVAWMEQEIGSGNAMAQYYVGTVRAFRETGRDVILRDAPHLVVAMASEKFARGKENAHFSFAYAELYAPILGLGTCWAGFLQMCAFCNWEPLLQLLDLPAGLAVAGALMVGYPKYSYPRLVNRNPLQVTWR